jgi:outer membrane protein assembly factor BamB
MKSLQRTVLQAAAVLCAAAAGTSFAVHADEAPGSENEGKAPAGELVLDLADASIPITLADGGSTFVIGHSTDKGWFQRVAAGNPRSPAVEEGVVVVGSGGGAQVFGYDVATGEKKWTASSKDSGISDIVIGLGRAYYTTYSCTLESVRVADGKQMYSKYLAPTVDCAPDIKDDLVATAFHKSGDWQVSMRDAEVGGPKWNSKVGGPGVLTAPIISSDGVFVTRADGMLTRLNLKKGTAEWTADLGAVSAPVVTRWGLMVTTTWEGPAETVVGNKAAEADRKKRERETVTEADSIPGTIVASKDKRVALLSDVSTKPEGKIGKQDTGPRATLDFQGVRPGVTDKRIIFAYGGKITAVDPVLGSAIWSLKVADEKCAFVRPVTHRGLVFVAADNGVVSAIEESTGALIWSYRFPNMRFLAAPAVDESHLFLTTSTGHLICMPTGAGNVDAGKPRVAGDDGEGTAAAYWRVQELFRKVRDIVREIEAAKPIEPQTPAAGDGSSPASDGPDGATPEDEAVRPREDAEVEELTKGQWDRREERREERARSEGKAYERKEYKR